MVDACISDDIETRALGTAIGLLDALMDSCVAAMPGRNAAHYAEDLRHLGDTAAQATADLEALRDRLQAARQAVA